jgi:hypothetical protein
MRIECPRCGVSGQVDPARVTGLVRCPKCGESFAPQSGIPPAPRAPASGPRIGVGPLADQAHGLAPGREPPPGSYVPPVAAHLQPFRAGDALGKTFSVWVRNFVPFTLLTAIVLAPTIILDLAVVGDGAPVRRRPGEVVRNLDTYLSIARFFLGLLVSGTVVFGVFQQLRGRHATAMESFAKGLRALPSILGVGLLFLLALGGGLMVFGALVFATAAVLGPFAFFVLLFLLVPLIGIPCGLFVAVPAAVVERSGSLGAIRRSWDLTRGSRLKIFLIVVILLLLASFAVGFTVGIVGGIIAGGSSVALIAAIVGALSQVLTSSLVAVAAAVVYHDLRLAKEGIGIEELASVFD